MEFSFGGLMNFGRNQIPAPDTSILEHNFEILDQQQSYNMQSVNGKSNAQVTWTYSLAPIKTGNLKIPSLTYKDAESKPISIEVLGGKAPKNANNPPNIFIEVEVDKQTAYVQEQVIYTIRLYTAGRLSSGNLSEPTSTNAIIEPFGEDKKTYRMAYNRRYEVIERQYLLFPQKSGQLSIDAQSFNGMMIDSYNRRRARVRETSETVSISVLPPPASFSGDVWLPATSLRVSDSWEGDKESLLVGDSITRNIDISALGLLGSALPPINMSAQKGLKVYPDQPLIESFSHESGSQSIRKQSTALVAVNATQVDLPEIRIPWWDTVNNVERVEVIPAQRFSISVNPEAEIAPTTNSPYQASINSSTNNTTEFTAPNYASGGNNNTQAWLSLIALLIFGWIGTSWFLLKRLQSVEGKQIKFADTKVQIDPADLLRQVQSAIKANDKSMTKHLILWLQVLPAYSEFKIVSIADLKSVNAELYTQARLFENLAYAPTNSDQKFDSKLLTQCINQINTTKKQQSSTQDLSPFYP